MVFTGGDAYRGRNACYMGRRQEGWRQDRTIAHLSKTIIAPALNGPVTQRGARMSSPGGNLGYFKEICDRNRKERADTGAVAELPGAVISPAGDLPVTSHRAGMKITGRYLKGEKAAR